MTLSAAVHRLFMFVAGTGAGSAAHRNAAAMWRETFACWPVWPDDEHGLFWLEPLWRRRNPVTLRWEYRSWRSDAEKSCEAEVLTNLPLIH